MIVDSYKYLPRSFRPLYEGRGAFPGEESPLWAPFSKRLSDSRIALLSSAGLYVKASQPSFDMEREESHPEWGDPTWRAIPARTRPDELGVAHLHLNEEDVQADPEIALPMRLLAELVPSVTDHVSVMGYQDRSLSDWRAVTAPAIVTHLREQGADGVVLAPA